MGNKIVFETPNQCYGYDRYSNHIFKISKELYQEIENGNKLTDLEWNESGADERNSQFQVEQIEHPETELLEYKYARKVATLTLQITQQCNLRCSYCVYSGNYHNREHANKIMSEEVAKKGIDFLAEHSIDSKRVHIGFYGGEPLLRFPFIKQQIEYAQKRLKGKQHSFGLTSNGTLLTEEIVKFFSENNVALTISLDGDEKCHDKNRKFANSEKGSFQVILEKLQMVHDNYPEYFSTISYNVVIDPVNPFKETAEFFKENSLVNSNHITASLVSSQYALKENTASEIFNEEYGYEIFKFFLAKLGILEREEVSRLLNGYFAGIEKIGKREDALLQPKAHHSGPCVPGIQRLFVSIDGTLYPCERVNEESEVMKIGSVFSGFLLEKGLSLLNIGKLTSESCKNCWALRLCTICAAFADDSTKLSKEKKARACKEIRERTRIQLKNYCMLREFGYAD